MAFVIRLILPLFLFSSLLCGQVPQDEESIIDDIMKSKAMDIAQYGLNTNTAITDRIKTVPDFVLKAWEGWDKRDYSAYELTPYEKDIVVKYFEFLSPAMKKILKNRLLGIYFVNDLLGSGMADWVLDDKKNVYFYLLFNPALLKMNLSQTLSWRESSCFIPDSSGNSVVVDCDTNYNGFLYVLIHETAHAADYVLKITPYVEYWLYKILKFKEEEKEFTSGVWKDYSELAGSFNFPEFGDVTFYGMNNGPKIQSSQAKKIYDRLNATPFVSLYSIKCWADDFADFTVFYYLTQKMGQPYAIYIMKDGKKEKVFDLSRTKKFKKRAAIIEKTFFE